VGASGRSAAEGLQIADRIGDLALSAKALDALGTAAYREGDLAQARDLREQALGLYRRLGDEAGAAVARVNLGLVHKNLCEWEAAIAHLRAAYDTWHSLGRFAQSAIPLMNLGIVYQKMGAWDQAVEYYRKYEAVLLQVGDELHLAHVNIGLGN